MNKLLILILLISSQICWSQTSIGLYEWEEVVEMQKTDINGSTIGETILTKIGQKFRVIATNKDGLLVLKIIDYGTKDPNFYTYNFLGQPSDLDSLAQHQIDAKQYGKYQAFFLAKADYVTNTKIATKNIKKGGSLSIGLITLPYKFRFQKKKNEFEGSFNFGASLGYRFPKNDFNGIDYIVAFGVHHTSIKLDSISVGSNAESLVNTNNYSALSFSLGFIVEYEKIQVGLFVGIDKLNRNNQDFYKWEYQNKPWVSLAFGSAIYSNSSNKQ